ncbi:membrane bound O-acyl transferase family-domain-containing protein [Colletotrichum cereale]|nr:membrane bound O-acyl transferase family-domain-containing protein [Colletotrichum cereale]
MALERADFVGALWLTTPFLLLLGSRMRRELRWVLLLPFVAFCSALVFAFPYSLDIAKNYTFGTVFYVGLANFNLLVLQDPYIEHVWTKGNSDGSKAQPNFYSLRLREQVRWCFGNAFSTRGIGWNWGVAHLPPAPPPGTSKATFLRLSAARVLRQYVIHDIGAGLLLWLTRGGRTPVLDLDFIPRSLATACWFASSITVMDIVYHLVCMVGVSSGLFWARVEEVHPVNGPWVGCYTLSRFWGRTWHQNFRRGLQIPSAFVARRIVRAPRGSLLSRHVQSYVAFAISGLYHWAAAKITVPSASFARTLVCFLLLPNVVLLEDLMITFARERLGWQGPHWRAFGLLWTFLAMTTLAAGFVDDLVTHGLVTAFPALPFSPTCAVLNLMVEKRA